MQDQTPFIQGIDITNFITPYTLIPRTCIQIEQQQLEEFYLDRQVISEEQDEIESQEERSVKKYKNLIDMIEQEYDKYRGDFNRIDQVDEEQPSENIQNQFNQDQQNKFYKFLSHKENNIGIQYSNSQYLKQTRKIKVQRYLKKKQRRNWRKKISYFCRKQVADSRLRIKGRFITRDQVTKMFNININNLSIQQIKQLIEAKLNSKDQVQTTESHFSEDLKLLV